ncbi:MAG: VWA domain-containing protein [Candidatus Heimdallarchaeota archaeon]|nr:VWA domain-containing protein [Candidatus Heimdallarchaeota archaeon]MDH5646876.1 VWA domain-containing protein [Candidatus Heimdallarchaeota archaeon]
MKSINKFLTNLQELGFTIATAEKIQAYKLLQIAENPLELKLGLRMTLCQNLQEQILFDLLWNNLYIQPELIKFNKPALIPNNFINIEQLDVEFCPNVSITGFGETGSSDPSISLMKFDSKFKNSAKMLIQGNTRQAAAILLRYMLSDTFDLSEFNDIRQQALNEVKEMLDFAITSDNSHLINRLNQELDTIITERLENPPNYGRNPLSATKIDELPIYQLRETPQLQHALQLLGKRLATRYKRKLNKGKNKINLRKTIRANIQNGGILFNLKRQKRRLERPKLIIITDVSSSTIQATKLFLSIIWNSREVFGDIKYYEFVGTCIDVTTEMKRSKSSKEGIQAILKKWNQQIEGTENSDYYRAFRDFNKFNNNHYSNNTSIIILGDLRDWLGPWNQDTPKSAVLMGEIRKKVKRMIVLNPEQKREWNTGDSIVKYVENRNIEVFETSTLEKLIHALTSM